jgi:branched-subunit amino acid transport protein AzlD
MKQTIVARSSTEAEYCALATIAELVWLHFLLKDMGISISTTTSIYCDNRSAIQSAQDDVSHEQT